MSSIDTNQYLGAFLDEASDNLKGLDDLTLELEKDPEDMSVVNGIFRTAHTLKGMSATMGFQNMASLTHALEDRLDEARSGRYHLGEADVDMILQCLDIMQSMVDSIRAGDTDAKIDVSELVKSLRSFKDNQPKAVKKESEKKTITAKIEVKNDDSALHADLYESLMKEAYNSNSKAFSVNIELNETCLLKAARAYIIINRLEETGTIFKTEPSIESVENEDFENKFRVFLISKISKDEIKDILQRISEISAVNVDEIDISSVENTTNVAADANADYESSIAKDNNSSPLSSPATNLAVKQPANAKPQSAAGSHKSGNQTVRVDIGRLDKLMNLVGELVIGRARIERLVQEAHLREFDDPLSQLGRISSDIQELVTKLRMVPVSFIFDRFPRLIRDISKNLGKDVQLVLEGQDTELDRTVIDEIGDPMVHLIRNSLDHGIETPSERLAIGKPEKGTLKISAYQEGSGVIIEVQDDGKGINIEKVKKKAIEKGLLTTEEAQIMPDEEAIKIIFLPGFSLAASVTDLSGRGVGMDAVKTKVEALGGQFDVTSKLGVGTRVFVRLPLTLAIVLALLIKVGSEVYAMPLENVEETILVKKENVRTLNGTPATLLRGEVLSLWGLASSLGTPRDSNDRDEYPVVVVKTSRNRIGFIVDELIGQQEIVIKSLGKFLSKINGIGGATILGDGNVALILDVTSLSFGK
ncbi:MAG: chemotaxis protein CheA [Synergistaceae bacterium]|nr:chemotaxis protein CheA [Synergistaceae bacterium]